MGGLTVPNNATNFKTLVVAEGGSGGSYVGGGGGGDGVQAGSFTAVAASTKSIVVG